MSIDTLCVYNSRKWDEQTYDVVKELSDQILYGASPDELPSIPAIVNEVAGAPPTIEDDDQNPESTMEEYSYNSRYSVVDPKCPEDKPNCCG